jgi:hypothetical protein
MILLETCSKSIGGTTLRDTYQGGRFKAFPELRSHNIGEKMSILSPFNKNISLRGKNSSYKVNMSTLDREKVMKENEIEIWKISYGYWFRN